MTKKMKAAVVHQLGAPLSVEEVAIPEVGPGQALLKIMSTGVCHTDLHAMAGDWPVKPHAPFIPGHEGVGYVVAVGAGVTAGVALQRGVIDALAYFDTGFGQIEAANIPIRMLPRPKDVPLIGGLYLSTMANTLKTDRKMCVGFARAVAKSSEFLLANPEAGARVFLKLYPETAPRGASEADAVKSVLFAARRRIPLFRPPYPNTKMGFIHEDELKRDAQFLGLDIKDVKPLMSNDLIDEINDFDRAKVIEQAKNYKA